MKGTILLNYSENTKQIEEEEKQRFLKDLLEQMTVPIEEFWFVDGLLSIEQKIKLRSILSLYNIQVIDDLDGKLQIYVENEKVAEWKKPIYKLKRDFSQLDTRKQLYLEMLIEYWSMFEEQENNE